MRIRLESPPDSGSTRVGARSAAIGAAAGLLAAPFAVGLSLTFLPTTPGGALWMFSFLMIVVGCSLAFGRPRWRQTA